MKQWRAHGKLLLTAEYFVLEGATALAVPARLGQSMQVFEEEDGSDLFWKARDHAGKIWLEAHFHLPEFNIESASDPMLARRLQFLLRTAFSRSEATPGPRPGTVITRLEFPRDWGLGSSSTLVWLVSRWAGTDPFQLQFLTFGGSGYDVACAGAEAPIFYKVQNRQPTVKQAGLHPPFAHQLFFLWLKRKQDSRDGIARFRELTSLSKHLVDEFTELSRAFCNAQRAQEWKKLIEQHENLVSRALRLPKVKDLYFQDFPGAVKSLGAWGGDFALVLSPWPAEPTRDYFAEKGFDTLIPWKEMVLTP